LTPAFSGKWTVSGDDQEDLLAKALAGYNGVDPTQFAHSTWRAIYPLTQIKRELIAFQWRLTIKDFEQ